MKYFLPVSKTLSVSEAEAIRNGRIYDLLNEIKTCVDTIESIRKEPLDREGFDWIEVEQYDPRFQAATPQERLQGLIYKNGRIGIQSLTSSPWIGLLKKGQFPGGLGETLSKETT